MKVNWFSPLPPARTEIAQHTLRLLPALAERTELTLWTDQPKWDHGLERFGPVRFFDPRKISWSEIHRGGLSVYNIGNSGEFHGAIWEVSRQHPGLVILHDLSLQHLFACAYREQRKDRAGYIAVMKRFYGLQGEKAADDYCRGLLSTEYMGEVYPLTQLALENALGVLVHTRPAFESLRHDSRRPLAYAGLPYAASPIKRQSQNAGPPYRLIVFGYLGRNRCLGQILQALAEFPDRDVFHLDIYGQIWDADSIRARVQDLRVGRHVTLHGFVPEETLHAALDAAHLALNLRYPSAGEASASQLRIWNHVLPSLVTRTGWYASLPEDAVAFVTPQQEVLDLQVQWRAFLDDPTRFARLGERGRRLLADEHTPEAYVQTLLGLIGSPERLRLRAAACTLAERVGAEMSAWLSRNHGADVYRPAAEQIRVLAL